MNLFSSSSSGLLGASDHRWRRPRTLVMTRVRAPFGTLSCFGTCHPMPRSISFLLRERNRMLDLLCALLNGETEGFVQNPDAETLGGWQNRKASRLERGQQGLHDPQRPLVKRATVWT